MATCLCMAVHWLAASAWLAGWLAGCACAHPPVHAWLCRCPPARACWHPAVRIACQYLMISTLTPASATHLLLRTAWPQVPSPRPSRLKGESGGGRRRRPGGLREEDDEEGQAAQQPRPSRCCRRTQQHSAAPPPTSTQQQPARRRPVGEHNNSRGGRRAQQQHDAATQAVGSRLQPPTHTHTPCGGPGV